MLNPQSLMFWSFYLIISMDYKVGNLEIKEIKERGGTVEKSLS
jgi:hypothetical protein